MTTSPYRSATARWRLSLRSYIAKTRHAENQTENSIVPKHGSGCDVRLHMYNIVLYIRSTAVRTPPPLTRFTEYHAGRQFPCRRLLVVVSPIHLWIFDWLIKILWAGGGLMVQADRPDSQAACLTPPYKQDAITPLIPANPFPGVTTSCCNIRLGYVLPLIYFFCPGCQVLLKE